MQFFNKNNCQYEFLKGKIPVHCCNSQKKNFKSKNQEYNDKYLQVLIFSVNEALLLG